MGPADEPGGPISRQPAGRFAMARRRAHARRPHLRAWPATPISPIPFIWARWAAAYGRPKTPAAPGIPIADEGIPIGSIGAIAVAPSNPNIVYVGTGEPDIRSQHSYGIGMYKSTDAGKTWTHIGLEDTRQIGRVAVDPTNPNRVYVAALGHVYDANPERGVYRSTDGGATWKKILFNPNDPNDVGAVDVAIDPKNPARALCLAVGDAPSAMVRLCAVAICPAAGSTNPPMAAIPGSSSTGGLPTDDFVGKIGIAIAPSNPNRLWAVVDDTRRAPSRTRALPTAAAPRAPIAPHRTGGGGIYISDDAGATWKLVNSENRLWGRGWYFEQVAVDPVNPDRAYVINTATYMTTDGGKTFVPVKGGARRRRLSPDVDQSQRRQPHGAQQRPGHRGQRGWRQDAGAPGTTSPPRRSITWPPTTASPIGSTARSRIAAAWASATWSREGVLSFRNWEPTCLAGESNTVVPDPKDGNILYGGGAGRCDQYFNTAAPLGGQLPAARSRRSEPQNVDAAGGFLAGRRSALLLQSIRIPHRATAAAVGEDQPRPGARCTRQVPEDSRPRHRQRYRPADDRPFRRCLYHRPLAAAGDHSLGRHRRRPDLRHARRWQDLEQRHAAGDDGVEQGLADRGRPFRRGDCLRVGRSPSPRRSEALHLSHARWRQDLAERGRRHPRRRLRQFGEGRSARPRGCSTPPPNCASTFRSTMARNGSRLQNNMPVTSVRDIVVHGDDLDVATHGRGFWVLDQMAALRQIAAKGAQIGSASAYLFKPGETFAIRQGGMNGTPLPHEEPQELNPPSGVVAYYWLKTAPAKPLKIELLDGGGAVRACAASDTAVRPVDLETLNVQEIWERPRSRHRPLPGCIACPWALPPDAAVAAVSDAAGRTPPAPDACTPPGGRSGRG